MANFSTSLATLPTTCVLNAGALETRTLTQGVYDAPAGSLALTGSVTLDGLGDPNAVFMVRASTSVGIAASADISFINGANGEFFLEERRRESSRWLLRQQDRG